MFNRATAIGRTLAANALAAAGAEAAQLAVVQRIPAYMQRGFGVRQHYRGKMRRGLHVTAKSHRGLQCFVSVGEHPDARIERLQMLKDRKVRRNG